VTIDLAIVGQGAVSPAGIGLEALLHRSPVASAVNPLGAPEETWPVLRVDPKEPALQRWQREPRLRRASPITYFLVEAAEQALAGLDAAERAQTGLIIAYSTGCLFYSRRFFTDIISQGQHSAAPALFPETVFNSPVSHVATVLKLNGAAYAIVGDASAWAAALKTAAVWLRQKRVRHVLVLGAEEFDPLVLDAYRSVRWVRRTTSNGFIAGEGAAGVLVTLREGGGVPRIVRADDGFIYRNKKEAVVAATKLFADTDPALPVFASAEHNWLRNVESAALRNRTVLPSCGLPYLGEAFIASAAWNTLRVLNFLDSARPRVIQPVWGLNHQFARLELARPA
jgi:hypothetical protein